MTQLTIRWLATCVWAISCCCSHAQLLDCAASETRHAISIEPGTIGQFEARARSHMSDQIEVFGDQSFYLTLDNGWVFALIRISHGWAVRVYDRETLPQVDLTQITPPFSAAVPNARDIQGWHFRNARNTGVNQGDVNAPQALRVFHFSEGLTGTGGFKPSAPDAGVDNADGRGWLQVVDYALSDLAPGQRASMKYLKFQACLTWPKTETEQAALADATSPVFTPEEIETFGACGLNLTRYELDAVATFPRVLQGDLDDDDVIDQVVRVRRKSDRQLGVAICLAGTSLDMLGFDAAEDLSPNVQHIIRAFSRWAVTSDAALYRGWPWPQDVADVLVLERPEKGMAWVYWQAGTRQIRDVYQHVEP